MLDLKFNLSDQETQIIFAADDEEYLTGPKRKTKPAKKHCDDRAKILFFTLKQAKQRNIQPNIDNLLENVRAFIAERRAHQYDL